MVYDNAVQGGLHPVTPASIGIVQVQKSVSKVEAASNVPRIPAATIAARPIYGLAVPSKGLYSMLQLSGWVASGQHSRSGASLQGHHDSTARKTTSYARLILTLCQASTASNKPHNNHLL